MTWLKSAIIVDYVFIQAPNRQLAGPRPVEALDAGSELSFRRPDNGEAPVFFGWLNYCVVDLPEDEVVSTLITFLTPSTCMTVRSASALSLSSATLP